MRKFSKLVIKYGDECLILYDDDTQDGIDIYPDTLLGRQKLLDYVEYLLDDPNETEEDN